MHIPTYIEESGKKSPLWADLSRNFQQMFVGQICNADIRCVVNIQLL